MIAYVRGALTGKDPEAAIVEAGGVGYRIIVGSRTLAALPPVGTQVAIHTYLHVREDAHLLYGFLDGDEKDMFRRVIAVSGIGPKIAMNILSGLSPAELAVAIVTDDVRAISRVNGVGRKTAERLILELKEKIGGEELVPSSQAGRAAAAQPAGAASEAIQALMALGYSSAEAARAVSRLPETCATVEEIVVHALQQLDRG